MYKTCIVQGTVETTLATFPPDSFGACLSDPPYGLNFLPGKTKGWDTQVPSVDVLAALLRVLRPGAWCAMFGHPRLWHRVATNAEDAGFRIRDTLIWLYGSGFPKSKNAPGGLGTALKPAWEPILLLQKPEPRADTYLDIDAARVPGAPLRTVRVSGNSATMAGMVAGVPYVPSLLGRWPANLVLDAEAGALLDAQSGQSKRGGCASVHSGAPSVAKGREAPRVSPPSVADEGGASRFFYCAKASTTERDEGLDAFPILTAQELVGRDEDSAGAKHGRAGAGHNGGRRNPHPTVKPLALTTWLAKLLRGNAQGPLLVPYSGVGSELIGAMGAGWTHAVGIEMDARYTEIAKARLQHRGHSCLVRNM
jgi:hypothetical protein